MPPPLTRNRLSRNNSPHPRPFWPLRTLPLRQHGRPPSHTRYPSLAMIQHPWNLRLTIRPQHSSILTSNGASYSRPMNTTRIRRHHSSSLPTKTEANQRCFIWTTTPWQPMTPCRYHHNSRLTQLPTSQHLPPKLRNITVANLAGRAIPIAPHLSQNATAVGRRRHSRIPTFTIMSTAKSVPAQHFAGVTQSPPPWEHRHRHGPFPIGHAYVPPWPPRHHLLPM